MIRDAALSINSAIGRSLAKSCSTKYGMTPSKWRAKLRSRTSLIFKFGTLTKKWNGRLRYWAFSQILMKYLQDITGICQLSPCVKENIFLLVGTYKKMEINNGVKYAYKWLCQNQTWKQPSKELLLISLILVLSSKTVLYLLFQQMVKNSNCSKQRHPHCFSNTNEYVVLKCILSFIQIKVRILNRGSVRKYVTYSALYKPNALHLIKTIWKLFTVLID